MIGGPTPGCVFWTNGRLSIIRHCEGIFSLECDGNDVMSHGPFERITNYAWAEFDVMEAA